MLIETLRRYYRSHPALTTTVALLPLIAAALVGMFFSAADGSTPAWPMADYVDLETGEHSQRPADQVPPLTGKSGKPSVVRAIYLTPSTPEHRFLAYYEKYADDAHAAIVNGPRAGAAAAPSRKTGLLVRLPGPDVPWLKAESPEAKKMLDAVFRPDPAKPPLRLCPP